MTILATVLFFALVFGGLLWFAKVFLPNRPVTGPWQKPKKRP